MQGDQVSVLPGSVMLGKTYAYGEPSNAALARWHPGMISQHYMSRFLDPGVYELQGVPVALSGGISVPTTLLLLASAPLGSIHPLLGITAMLSGAVRSAQASAVQQWYDPLVLDLNGDGQLATAGRSAGAYFDFDANGFEESAGWVGPSDGLVVRDLDGNGRIDTGRELFGDQTLLPPGALATNGFHALAALDSNADGKVSATDTAWGELRIWKDANSDGRTDAGELVSLDEAGVSSVNLGYTNVNQGDGQGNILAQAGTFTRANGSVGKAGSFLFERDVTKAVATDWLAVPEAVAQLPDIDGFGGMYSLHQAMVRDSTLAAQVGALAASTDHRALRAQFEAVLWRWAGSDGLAAGSRGGNIDARALVVLEKFYGQGFAGVGGANPNTAAAPILQTAYASLLSNFFAQFLAQAQLKPVWDSVGFAWNASGTVLQPDFSKTAAALRAAAGNGDSTAVQLAFEFGQSIKTFGFDAAPSFGAFRTALAADASLAAAALSAGLAGQSILLGAGAADTLTVDGAAFGFAGDDVISGSSGGDVLVGGAGADKLYGNAGADTLEGGDGNDTLDGGDGADVLRGGAGDDMLGRGGAFDSGYSPGGVAYGASSGNTYEGGTGNDVLNGTMRADLYLFNLGDGADVINEVEVTGQPAGQIDVLRFGAGISAADISVSRSGLDLVLSHINGTDKVTVGNWFNKNPGTTNFQVERVEFADGASWSAASLTAPLLTITGTSAANTLVGVRDMGNIILGRAGDDMLHGGEFIDLIQGDEGDDTVYAGSGDDVVRGGAGADTLSGDAGADTLEGGDGNDILDGGDGADVLRGGAGDDTLGGLTYDSGFFSHLGFTLGGSAGNIYEGGSGNDVLNGTMRADLYLFNLGDGADVINEVEVSGQPAAQVDVLRFGAGISAADISVSRTGLDLVLSHVNGTDKVTVRNWFNNSPTTSNFQIERAEFADGTSWAAAELTSRGLDVTGTAAADTLTGVAAMSNTIFGGAGNDVITGGSLADTLLGGDGNDTIRADSGDDFVQGGAGADSLSGDAGADTLEGGDGSDALDGGDGADVLRGGAGDDVLGGMANVDSGYSRYGSAVGASAGNTYEGGSGNDVLNGTMRADLYLFNLGDGADVINEIEVSGQPAGQVDVLRFGAGISAADIGVSRTGLDLVLSHISGTDKVTMRNWFNNSPATSNYQIERVEFADGASWAALALTAPLQAAVMTGTDGADTLEGGDGNDILDGGDGADVLRGGAGDDVLGGVGNDDSGRPISGSVTGASAGNTYEGGTGNDVLNGTMRADLYLFNLGDGADVINEVEVTGQPAGQVDVLRFGAGISAADISISRTGLDLVLSHINGTDKVTVRNWFNNSPATSNYQIERVEFADGSSWAAPALTAQGLNVTGTAAADTLAGLASLANRIDGGAGNDTITGGGLADTLLSGEGNDTISAGAGNDFLQGGSGTDDLFGGSGADVLEGGEGNDRLDGGAGSDILRGGAGDDTLGGISNDDSGVYAYVTIGSSQRLRYMGPGGGNTYEGGEGNDVLNGTSMSDLYLFNLGDGQDVINEVEVTGQPTGQSDVLSFGAGITASDVFITRSGQDLVLAHINGTDRVTVRDHFASTTGGFGGLESVKFAGGGTWNTWSIESEAWAQEGTAGADALDALSGRGAELRGLEGDDVLNGGDFVDMLYGGEGSDTLYGGAGDDMLNGGRGADKLYGGDGNDYLGGAWESLSQDSGYSTTDAAGVSSYYDPLAGNTYEGGKGNDRLDGTARADLYLFNLGDGTDIISEIEVSGQPAGQVDVLRFGAGISAADISVSRAGLDLVLSHINGTDKVTVRSWFNNSPTTSNYQIERVEFADGASWSAAELTSRGLDVTGTAAADTLTGITNLANRINGGAGNDTLSGGRLADVLLGGEGDDTIYAGEGNDFIQGGAGADNLFGDARSSTYNWLTPATSDTYHWFAGDGFDTVTDKGGSSDTVVITAEGASLAFFRESNDLVVEVGSASEGMRIKGHFLQPTGGNQIENFVINGQAKAAADVALLAVTR